MGRPVWIGCGAVGARRVARPLEQLAQRLPAPLLRHGGAAEGGGEGKAPPRLLLGELHDEGLPGLLLLLHAAPSEGQAGGSQPPGGCSLPAPQPPRPAR